MKNLALALAVLAFACSKELGVPDGYCEKDCVELWTPSCEERCGTPEPGGGGAATGDSGASGNGGGAGGGGAGAGGSAISDGGDAGSGGAGLGGDGGAGTGGPSDAGTDGGTDGGDAGDGSMSPECIDDLDCPAHALAQCSDEGTCVACSSSVACSGRGVRTTCDVDSTSATSGQCVQCTSHADCTDADEPQCSASGVCEPCGDDAACEDRSATPRCNTASGSASEGRCVECMAHLDCDNPTPQCGSTHACEPCEGNDACDGRTGAEVCDDSADATFGGTCVRCTGQDYDCGVGAGDVPRVCNSLTRACSTELEESADVCEACVSDAQCQPGRLCVKQTFDDPTDDPNQGNIEIGYFCAWRADAPAGPDGACFDVPPYVARKNAFTSLDGTVADVCVLGRSTCPAHADFLNMDCAETGTPDDNLCGDADAPHDGYCEQTADPGVYRCTVPCGGDDDCPTGFACPLGSPRICTL